MTSRQTTFSPAIGSTRDFADFSKNNADVDLTNFANFTAEVYALWNFGKATNE
jgi:hypothetical protein